MTQIYLSFTQLKQGTVVCLASSQRSIAWQTSVVKMTGAENDVAFESYPRSLKNQRYSYMEIAKRSMIMMKMMTIMMIVMVAMVVMIILMRYCSSGGGGAADDDDIDN